MVKVNLGLKSFDDLKIAIQGLRLPTKNPVLSIDDPKHPEIVTVRGVSVRDLNPLVLRGYAVFQTAA